MRRSYIPLVALAGLLCASCAYWPRSGINGLFYANSTAPVGVMEMGETEPTKTGEACATGVLGLWGSGDSSIQAAKRAGGITKISTIEERFKHVFLGFYSKYCTVVTGW